MKEISEFKKQQKKQTNEQKKNLCSVTVLDQTFQRTSSRPFFSFAYDPPQVKCTLKLRTLLFLADILRLLTEYKV